MYNRQPISKHGLSISRMSVSVDQIVARLKTTPNHINYFTHAYASGYALSVAEVAKSYDGIVMLLMPDASNLVELKQEIEYFLGDDSSIPVITLPDWEILPYDYFSPHQDIISERLQTLHQLPKFNKGVLILPISSALQKLPPRQFIENQCLLLELGQTIEIDDLRNNLSSSGYYCVANVMEHGEFAVRGSIIDLFPMGALQPIRIELFDNEIESLRFFDPENQLTTQKVDQINLLPAKEYPTDEKAIADFRQNWRSMFDSNLKKTPIYNDVSKGIFPAGIEYYLPLFYSQLATIFDYIDCKNLLIVRQQNLNHSLELFWDELFERYEQYRYDLERPIVTPTRLFLPANEFNAQLKNFSSLVLAQETLENDNNQKKSNQLKLKPCPKVNIEHRAAQPLMHLQETLSQFNKALICAESIGRQEVLRELLVKNKIPCETVNGWHDFINLKHGVALTTAAPQQGFACDDWILICESDLFGNQILQSRRRNDKRISPDQLIHSLAELKIGDPVIHVDQGVGRYLGLQTISAGGVLNEFLTLEYSGGGKLYVPVLSLHLIHRYSGSSPETAPWHKLGNEAWSKAKRKAVEKVRDTAAELLDLYARRAAEIGVAHKVDKSEYELFSSEFEFKATPDQQTAFDAVLKDMQANTPMDRLICGDVGFGKTEVAMRATFIAVQSDTQVAILVPTTLLAQQHFNSFQDRFSHWPVNIAVLSRFQTKKEQREILEQIKTGQIDIIIGTHKLLSSQLSFKNLGLLIIDEEHRFGVRQKEILKSYRAKVDILTLTATPIPRTLNMSMSGMRDLSIIATPPEKRLAIKTFVRQRNIPLIKEAIQREVRRGGQIYFLHNSVESIQRTAQEIKEILPEIEVAVAHGQMRERELEDVMKQFYRHKYHVLVCTTIIETGIDIPTANTIIIDRADKLGLAQLHQLRGRVGRSHHQAYAYLLTANPKTITKDAKKRLEAIQNLETLGAGFILATHDLEIRGAGEMLGDEQSGHMQTIGFSLYMELLERAVEALKNGEEPSLSATQNTQAEINLGVAMLLPESYIPDVGIRLSIYKRIAKASSSTALRQLQVELIDRFGLLPDASKNLFNATKLKLRLTPMGVIKLDANEQTITLEFDSEPKVDTNKLIQLIQTEPEKYRLLHGNQLKVISPNKTISQREQQIDSLIETLGC